MHSPAVVNSSEFKRPAIESSHQPVVKGLFDTIKLWFARAQQRRQLAQLSDQLLKDIGLERTAALKESRKWFWQA